MMKHDSGKEVISYYDFDLTGYVIVHLVVCILNAPIIEDALKTLIMVCKSERKVFNINYLIMVR